MTEKEKTLRDSLGKLFNDVLIAKYEKNRKKFVQEAMKIINKLKGKKKFSKRTRRGTGE